MRPDSAHVQKMLHTLESGQNAWLAFNAALFLLGLRDDGVDQHLRRFAACLPIGPNDSIDTARFLTALDDPTLSRCDFSDLSPPILEAYAWLRPTEDEVAPLLEALLRQAVEPHRLSPPIDLVGGEQKPSSGWQPARLLIYDVVRMFGSASHHGIIDELPCHGTLETALRALSLGQEPPAPTHAPTFFPHWPPLYSSVFQRDPVTLSLNRGWWRCRPEASPYRWTLLVNIDGMRQINDIFSLPAGDIIIRSVAETLHQIVGDRSIRWRGDEWLVMSDQDDGPELARHIVKTIAEATVPIPRESWHGDPIELPDHYSGARMTDEGLRFTASVGVSSHPDFGIAFAQAEKALFQAKSSGRNCVALG